MSYASKFLNAKTTTTDTPAPSGPVFSTDTPKPQSSLFGRKPTTNSKLGNASINAEKLASNPWAAKAAAANGIKVEEKLDFDSSKQFPTLGGTTVTSAPKKGAWGSSTVTAAALAADWAAKDAEEKAAAAAEKARREEEEAKRAEERRQNGFMPTRSDIFRNEVYNTTYNEEDEYDDGYNSDEYIEERNYRVQNEWPEEEQNATW